MANFDFSLSSDIVLGGYSLARIGERIAQFSSRVMFITDISLKESGLIKKVQKALEEHSISVFTFDDMVQNPSSDVIERTINLARGAKVDGIIGLGGMSVCSIARCTAAFYNESESIYDFFDGKEPKSKPLPLCQIPTTCRDPFLFLEMTPVMDARNRTTKLIKLQESLGYLTCFDPTVFYGYPKYLLTSMIFAGLTSAFEGYISTKSNFFSKTILKRAIELFLLTINKQKEKLIETSVEQVLSEATCLTAIGLSTSSPGLGTAISLATSSRYDVSSSLVATILFPVVVNDAIKSNLDKVVDVARMLETDLVDETDTLAKAQAGVVEIRRLLSVSNLPMRLKDIELTIESLVPVAQDVASLSFISYLPRPMASSGIFELIKEAY
ncbi:MAG: iron-containing alcohol dehydrogenase [Spirochaetaceae bacterium]|nr:iron-containing alcohol dehydrogenase [Spirochaetaceae bacterium]